MISHEEIMVLKKEFEKYFDLRYVLKNDCDEIQKEVIRHFGNDDKRIEIISHDFEVIKKLMWVVASSSIGTLVVAFFELILK